MSTNGTSSHARPSAAFEGLGRIDVHHHCFPGTVPDLAPEFAHSGNVAFGVGFTGVFPTKAEDHLEYMDEVGIQTVVVTPSIKNEWHQDFSKQKWVQLCKDSLKAQLEYVSFNPLRFDELPYRAVFLLQSLSLLLGCFALLPLPHIEETIKFIRNASKLSTPPDGWGITTQIGNRYIGDPLFEPIWTELDKIGSVVFVHPADSVRPPNLTYGPFLQEYPFDTCRAMTNAIHSGILLRFPNIKFLFSHNGGAFPFLADRIGAQHIDEMIAKNNNGLRLRDLLSTTNIYVDTSISSAMQYPLIKDLGIPTSHLLYATDFPYTKRKDSTNSYQMGYNAPRDSGLFDHAAMEDIVRNNSLKLFPRLAKEFDKVKSTAT